jgi:hypothetical protein
VCVKIHVPVWASVNRQEGRLGREKRNVSMQEGKVVKEEKEGKQEDRKCCLKNIQAIIKGERKIESKKGRK